MAVKEFPVQVFSQKAFDIINAYVCRRQHDCEVTRAASGAVNISAKFSCIIPDPTELMRQLFRLTWQSGIVNTVRTRSEDARTYRMDGKDFPMRDISLLTAIELHKYPEQSLRRWFGSEAYDEMVGHPSNPMVQAQREIYFQQLEELSKEKLSAANRIAVDIDSKIVALRLQRTEAIDASDAEFDAKIKAVKDALANLDK